jgi:hypothetical protein
MPPSTGDPTSPRSTAPVRRELTEDELDRIEADSASRVVRSPAEQELYHTGGDRRALQGRPWLPTREQDHRLAKRHRGGNRGRPQYVPDYDE